jgi:6-phosphogluconolactonase
MLTELSSRLFELEIAANGRLNAVGSHSTLPAGFDGASLGGHLALLNNGTRIYVSNRGHDSLAMFELDHSGTARLAQIEHSGGRSPRHFRLLENPAVVIVAHEESDAVCVRTIERDGRVGAEVAKLSVHRPAFIGAAEPDETR